MKKLVAICSALLLLCGCSKADTEELCGTNPDRFKKLPIETLTTEDVDNKEQFYEATGEFSVNLFKELYKSDESFKENNFMISPESIVIALSMLEAGSDGETKYQMESVIHNGITINELYDPIKDVVSNESFKLSNSLWIRDSFASDIADTYRDTCKDYFLSSIHYEPFNNNTVNAINKEVSDATDGMIDNIIKELNPDSELVLINCIAFDKKWKVPIPDYAVVDNEDFNNYNDSISKTVMLYDFGTEFIEGNDWQGVVRAYERKEDDSSYYFVGILPDDSSKFNKVLNSLTAEDIKKSFNNRTSEYELVSKIPEFKYDFGITLNSCFKNMGLTSIFDTNADFSGIAEKDIFVSDVMHKTFIDFNRSGTKAAASTAIIIQDNAMIESSKKTKKVIFDRPFIYAIVNDYGYPVFIGTVVNL